jgi:hypothetical protein
MPGVNTLGRVDLSGEALPPRCVEIVAELRHLGRCGCSTADVNRPNGGGRRGSRSAAGRSRVVARGRLRVRRRSDAGRGHRPGFQPAGRDPAADDAGSVRPGIHAGERGRDLGPSSTERRSASMRCHSPERVDPSGSCSSSAVASARSESTDASSASSRAHNASSPPRGRAAGDRVAHPW